MTRLRGRFRGGVDEAMQRFSSSLAIDLEMAEEDLDGSVAHATMLGEVGVISSDEATTIVDGLEAIRMELRDESFRPGDEFEDIHMAVEARLIELVGDVGKKLHTARSRNDQVATDVRLWLKKGLDEIDSALRSLLEVLLDRCEKDGQILLPGYTHLQRGQPVLLGHHLLAHAWALHRDRERLAGARKRVDLCPLGACAMAGTSHAIDRRRSAELLGFSDIVENAMDAVAARDHEQEVVATCAIQMTHVSRMAEELVLWSSSEWAFARLHEAYATGSSIMPQKRNPDAAELLRGKAAGVYGDLLTLLSLVKALPMAYNRDLQEDREPLFHAVETTRDSLRILAGVWQTLELEADRFETELHGDPCLATEIADYLSQRGMPFREAHEVVGRLALLCEARGGKLDALGPAELEELHPDLPADLGPWLDPRAAVERRTSLGGTAWSEVERQVAILRGHLVDSPL